jgi:uncharacterized membrane protein YhaH (DUF805 family)
MDTTGAFAGVLVAAAVIWIMEGDATRLTGDAFRVLVAAGAGAGFARRGDDRRRRAGRPAGSDRGLGRRACFGRAGASALRALRPPRSALSGASSAASPNGAASPAPFWLFMLANALFTLGNSSDAFLALRSQNLGLTLLALLLTIVAFNATNAVVAWPAGALSDRIGRRGLIAFAWLVYAACYAGFAIATRPSGSCRSGSPTAPTTR